MFYCYVSRAACVVFDCYVSARCLVSCGIVTLIRASCLVLFDCNDSARLCFIVTLVRVVLVLFYCYVIVRCLVLCLIC